LDDNKIENLAGLSALPELQWLSTTGNRIKRFLDLKQINRLFPKIVELRLGNNPITESVE
jgi:hypothetical protein